MPADVSNAITVMIIIQCSLKFLTKYRTKVLEYVADAVVSPRPL